MLEAKKKKTTPPSAAKVETPAPQGSLPGTGGNLSLQLFMHTPPIQDDLGPQPDQAESEHMVDETATAQPISHIGLALQRFPADAPIPSPASQSTNTGAAASDTSLALALLVEDEVENLTPGQMHKSAFLTEVQTAVCAAAEAVLAPAGRSTDDCPYLRFIFPFLRRRPATYIEATLRRFAPELRGVTSARTFIPHVVERVRQSTEHWVRTGKISGLPAGLPTAFFAAGAQIAAGEHDTSPAIQFKGETGGALSDQSPLAIQEQLGPGHPLDGGTAARIGTALGTDFSHVRAHTDATATDLSKRFNARAFTVGNHIAFGAEQYRPGTLVGDALIAHELAHTIQQRGPLSPSQVMQRGETNSNLYEEEADISAVGVVATLWGGIKNGVANIAHKAMTRVRSGLRLQRCSATYSLPLEAALTELDSASFDESAVLEAFRKASQAEIREAVQKLKLHPHLEHANYYRYLLFLMNRDLDDQEWREFEGMVADVAITGEAPLQLSNEAQQLLTFLETQLEKPNVSQLLQRIQDASTTDLDAALTTLRRRYNREHGHELHRLSSVVRDNATEAQYRQFISLLHRSGITLALQETDPRIGVLVEQETQLIREGAKSSLTDEQITGLFGTRALEIAYTMLRNSEQQLLQVMTRSRGTGATASQFDADIEQARVAYGRITGKVPNFISFDDFSAKARAQLQAAGHTVSEDALRQVYDRERQIAMYRFAAPEQARIVETIQKNQRRIGELRSILSRPTIYIRKHPLGGGPAGEWSRRDQAIRTRQRQDNELRRLEKATEGLTKQKQQLESALPLLGGLDVDGLQSLAALKGGSAQFDKLLAQALGQVFRNIEQSRVYLQSGDVKIWLLRPVVEATRRQLGIPENPTNDAQRRWNQVINAQIQHAVADERKVRETLQAINAGLLIIALGTALFSGGGSLALYATLTGTAVGIGSTIYGAIETSTEMMEREATYGSGLTAETRLSDVPPDYEFLVHAWLGVGIEIALAVFMIRSLARSGALSQLRGDAVAVRQRVQDIARRLRGRGAAASEQQLTESMMDALEQRGWVGATGGVRGPTSYVLTGNTGPGRLANNVNDLVGNPRAHGAQFTNPSGSSNSLQYTLRVPMRGTSGRHVTVAVEMESVEQANLAAAGHGAEAGPARLILERTGGQWRARIQVAREIRHQDVRFVVGHELDETARIVQNSPRASAAEIAAAQEASLFRRGGSPAVTAHDQAAAAELRALEEELQPLLTRAQATPAGQPVQAVLANEISWRQARLARVMDSMGLAEATNMGTKLSVLREAGISEDLIRGVRARWQQGSYFTSPGYQALEASSPHLRAAGSIMNDERLVGHIMIPGPPRGGFVGNGLHGGHHTDSLLEWTNRNPTNRFVVVEEANRGAARTTFRRYSQYQWLDTGPKPVPGDPRLPRPAGSGGRPVAGTHYDSTLWQLSSQPKTTADSIQILMREADDAWVQWRTTNPGYALNPANTEFGGLKGIPPAVSTGGVEFSGFYSYDATTQTWSIKTVFMEGAWIP
jgi:hypothetical protein